jgi:hypothetical protein
LPGHQLALQGEAATSDAAFEQILQQHIPCFLGLLAGLHLKICDTGKALQLIDNALARVERIEERWFEADYRRGVPREQGRGTCRFDNGIAFDDYGGG